MRATRAPEQRRWRNRSVAHEVDRARTRSTWTAVGALILALAPFGAYGFAKSACLGLNAKIKQLQERQEQLTEQRRRLSVQRAELQSLEKIEQWAVRRGMVRPGATQIVMPTAIEATHVRD